MSASSLSEEEIPPMFVSSAGFDDLGAILDRLDLPYTDLDSVDLSRRDEGIVMLNCSFSWRNEVDLSSLESFVRDGGAVLASDLTYNAISYVSDATFEKHDWGNAVDAEVVDSELADLLGRDRLELDFDTALKKVDSLPRGANPLIRTVSGDHVIAYQSSVGRGEVVYTSFHNHSQSSEVENALLQVLLMVPIAESTGTTVRETYTTVVHGGSSGDDTTVVRDVQSGDDTGTVVFETDDSVTVTLVVTSGSGGEVSRELDDGESVTIGRSDFSGIVDPARLKYVSGTHLELRNDAAGHEHVEVRDADSTNGTSLDGEDVSDEGYRTLEPGAELDLAGEVEARVRYE